METAVLDSVTLKEASDILELARELEEFLKEVTPYYFRIEDFVNFFLQQECCGYKLGEGTIKFLESTKFIEERVYIGNLLSKLKEVTGNVSIWELRKELIEQFEQYFVAGGE